MACKYVWVCMSVCLLSPTKTDVLFCGWARRGVCYGFQCVCVRQFCFTSDCLLFWWCSCGVLIIMGVLMGVLSALVAFHVLKRSHRSPGPRSPRPVSYYPLHWNKTGLALDKVVPVQRIITSTCLYATRRTHSFQLDIPQRMRKSVNQIITFSLTACWWLVGCWWLVVVGCCCCLCL